MPKWAAAVPSDRLLTCVTSSLTSVRLRVGAGTNLRPPSGCPAEIPLAVIPDGRSSLVLSPSAVSSVIK